MRTENAAEPAPSDREETKRTRRGLPITKRIARNGKVSYTFQVDTGTRPDGSRDRRRYTYATLAEAKREYTRIATDATAGTLVRRDKLTLGAFLSRMSRVPWNFGGGPVSIMLRSPDHCARWVRHVRRSRGRAQSVVPAGAGGR